jgi:hypothetical protein
LDPIPSITTTRDGINGLTHPHIPAKDKMIIFLRGFNNNPHTGAVVDIPSTEPLVAGHPIPVIHLPLMVILLRQGITLPHNLPSIHKAMEMHPASISTLYSTAMANTPSYSIFQLRNSQL